MKFKMRKVRNFSKAFKQEKVEQITLGKVSVREICKMYAVSDTAVYAWLRKYSKYPPDERVVVEKVSEEKQKLVLMQKVAELEGVIGRKQLEIIYLESVISCGSDLLGSDLKKKFDTQQ